ncbi:flavodoxin domain-containing protein [Cellulosilyticum sp. I15G10I2]|uniref:flavodoxin domain-containing protein n=1 Tax=Cellulosilyticum sp. I15G10I2 TaxID=1892843 RepID=UPI00085C7AB9|nr:flavodoxin domain-containing protein [Cellulosilyticum sp. I15G10I2]
MSKEVPLTVVIYNSKYGSTKHYATWIAKEINADLFEDSHIKLSDLTKYSTIVFGGSLHAVGIKGVKLITKNYEALKNKKIIVFAVGCSPGYPEALTQVFNHNFKLIPKDKINFFYLRGAFNYNKLSPSDKLLMNALKAKIKLKKDDEINEDSKSLLACYDTPHDWTHKDLVVPIIKCITAS